MNTEKYKVSVIRLLMLIAFTATIMSFSIPLGMDNYKVYLNDKLLFKRYVHEENTKSISLNDNSASDKLTVYYDHCGRIGTSRTLSLLDGDKELKKWTYEDTDTESFSGMSCEVGTIKSLQGPGKTVRLMYDSKELSSPIQITAIAPATATTAKANR